MKQIQLTYITMPESTQTLETPVVTQPVTSSPKKRNLIMPLVAGFILLLILIGGAVITAYYFSNQNRTPEKNPDVVSNPVQETPKDLKSELGVKDEMIVVYLVKGDIYASSLDGRKTYKVTDTNGKVVAMAMNVEQQKIAYAMAERTPSDCGVPNEASKFNRNLPGKIYEFNVKTQETITLATSDKCISSPQEGYNYNRNMIPLAYNADASKLVYENGGTFVLDTKTGTSTKIDQQEFLTAINATWEGEYLAVDMAATEFAGTTFFKVGADKIEKFSLPFTRGELMPDGKVLHQAGTGDENAFAEGSDISYQLYDIATKQDQDLLKQKVDAGYMTTYAGNLYNITQEGKLNRFTPPSTQTLVLDFKNALGVKSPFDFFVDFSYQDKYFGVLKRTADFAETFDFVLYDNETKKMNVVFEDIKRMDQGIIREEVFWY